MKPFKDIHNLFIDIPVQQIGELASIKNINEYYYSTILTKYFKENFKNAINPLKFIHTKVTRDWYKDPSNLLVEDKDKTEEYRLNCLAWEQDCYELLTSIFKTEFEFGEEQTWKSVSEQKIEIFLNDILNNLEEQGKIVIDKCLKTNTYQRFVLIEPIKNRLLELADTISFTGRDSEQFKQLFIDYVKSLPERWKISTGLNGGVPMTDFATSYQKFVGMEVVTLPQFERRDFEPDFISALSFTDWENTVSYEVFVTIYLDKEAQDWETSFFITEKEYQHFLSLEHNFARIGYIPHLAQKYLELERRYGPCISSIENVPQFEVPAGIKLTVANGHGSYEIPYKVVFQKIKQDIKKAPSKANIRIQSCAQLNACLTNSLTLSTLLYNDTPCEYVLLTEDNFFERVGSSKLNIQTTEIKKIFTEWQSLFSGITVNDTIITDQREIFHDYFKTGADGWPANREYPMEGILSNQGQSQLEQCLDILEVETAFNNLEAYVEGFLEELKEMKKIFPVNVVAFDYMQSLYSTIEKLYRYFF
jgi:hypothetical protein